MNLVGKGKVLRIYLSEGQRHEGKPLHRVLLERFHDAGVAGATVFRGIEGYGASTRIRSTRLLSVMENLPLIVEVVDRGNRIRKALNLAEEILPSSCLVTLSNTHILHYHVASGRHRKTRQIPS